MSSLSYIFLRRFEKVKGKFIGGVVCGIAGMVLSVMIYVGGMVCGYSLAKVSVERKSDETK